MVKLKSISCYDKDNVIWEGKILVQESGFFEGIVDSDDKNSYIYGNFDVINESSINVTKITPEDYPYHLDFYSATFEDDLDGDKYFGEVMDVEFTQGFCFLKVNNINLNKELLEAEINDMKFIIDHYKATIGDRYNEELQAMREVGNREQLIKVEKRLHKNCVIRYYL